MVEQPSKRFDIFISELVLSEASRGNVEAAQRRMGILADIPELELTEHVRKLGKALIEEGAIPPNAEVDALHLAIAAVNGLPSYLELCTSGKRCHEIENRIRVPEAWI